MPHTALRPKPSAQDVFGEAGRLEALRRTGLLDTDPELVFDRAAALASRLLGTKVGLLSLVDETRQFFKARVGLDVHETPLSHSFCKHVVADDGPLVVPDAREHPVLRDNPAIKDLDVVAYLGVPIHSPEGAVLGSFCVIDPEPKAWSDDDLEILRDLAVGLESEIALRSALASANAAEERYKKILDLLPIGVAVAAVPSAELLMMNSKGAELLAEEVEAKDASSYRALGGQHPDGRRYKAEDYPLVRTAVANEIIVNEPMVYHRNDGRRADLEVSASRIETDVSLAVATFVETTERQQALREVQAMKDRLARTLEATTDGVFVLDEDQRLTFVNERAHGMLGSGRDPIGLTLGEAFPSLARGGLPETCAEASRTGHPAETDELQERDGIWFEARAFPTGSDLTVFLRDITEERRSAETRQLLVRELNHRVKNLFAVVSGMVAMTSRHSKTPREMAAILRGRLFALAKAHELIRPAVTMEQIGQPDVSLQNLVTSIIEPHIEHESDEIAIEGQAVSLGANGATSLALVMHELATNAAKYGSLSVPNGHLAVKWRNEADRIHLYWHETRGPGRPKPKEGAAPGDAGDGFGSTLIDLSVKSQLNGTIKHEWQDDGVCITLVLPVVRLQA